MLDWLRSRIFRVAAAPTPDASRTAGVLSAGNLHCSHRLGVPNLLSRRPGCDLHTPTH
jgi:hypothetical protein